MKRASPDSARSPFRVGTTRVAERALQREVEAWEQRNLVPSQLPDEYEAAVRNLATHPRLGFRMAGRRGHMRKLLLPHTGFVLLYRVAMRKRIVTIMNVLPKASIRHR